MSVKPITPKEAISGDNIPDEVIEAFNELIVENTDTHGCAEFIQKDVVDRICKKGLVTGLVDFKTKDKIFDKNWLNIETIYKKVAGL